MKIDFWDIAENTLMCAAVALLVASVILIGAIVFYAFVNETNAIDSGIIVDRNYNPGGTYWHTDGKHGGSMRSYPDSYTFTIEGEKNGEIVRYTFDVTAEEYAAYKIGDWYER